MIGIVKKFFIYWLPLLIWAFIIFGFSSQPYEQQDLRPLIEKHIDKEATEKYLGEYKWHYHGKEISINTLGAAGFIEFFIRKGAHLFEYALLGFLLFRAFLSIGIKKGKVFVISLVLALLYAASDEWHQSFTINRTPLISDVVTDLVGSFIGASFAWLFYSIKKPILNKDF